MRITQLQVEDMWSFANEPSFHATFGDRNLIVGRNNSGKSNVLRAIKWFTRNGAWFTKGDGEPQLPHGEAHLYRESRKAAPRISMGVSLTDTEIQRVLDEGKIREYPKQYREPIFAAFQKGVELQLDSKLNAAQKKDTSFTLEGGCSLNNLPQLVNMDQATATRWQSSAPSVRKAVLDLLNERIDFISGWRKLEDSTREGKPIFQVLFEWQDADPAEEEKHRKLTIFKEFFAKISGMNGLELRPIKSGQRVTANWHNRPLDFSAFGDGITHLLILAFEFLERSDNIFLVEEPETHLHPDLLRRLWDFIKRNVESQFIITTHSNVLLDDRSNDQILHITYDGDRSNARAVERISRMRDVLDDIGARPSDILQSNVVIWVEGPTDRMFFDKCIQLVQQNADENEMTITRGLHYEIILYGGSTGSYLTLCDEQEQDEHCEEIQNLINLMNLCRNAVFICDSDMKSADDALAKWKKRIKEECEKSDNKKRAVFWATEGREIENYISDRVLTEVYRELLAVDTLKVTLEKFQDLHEVVAALRSNAPEAHKWKTDYDDNKARHMKALVPKMTEGDLDHHHLRDRLKEVVDFIRNANSR